MKKLINRVAKFINKFFIIIVAGIIAAFFIQITLNLDGDVFADNYRTVWPTRIYDYLPNPGNGWQEAKNIKNPLIPESVAYRRTEYPWSKMNPQNGVYNWKTLDAEKASLASQGKQISFRISTMNSSSEVPHWVLQMGATLSKNNNPDYSNCTYQEEWGKFVTALSKKYDGDSRIAFIDISGYGPYNEWEYVNSQTNIKKDTLDFDARQRLIDMFIGGSSKTQKCRQSNGKVITVSYSYKGFHSTQLIMPFAGIEQSTYYVYARRKDVGFRYDCLGRNTSIQDLSRVETTLKNLWKTAPVIYEFCGSSSTSTNLIRRADEVLRHTHGSVTHDNFPGFRSKEDLENLLRNAGYRYYLKQVKYPISLKVGDRFNINMIWDNVGYAPSYYLMGDRFQLHALIVDKNNDKNVLKDWVVPTDFSQWLPANNFGDTTPDIKINFANADANNIKPGKYYLKIGIRNNRNMQYINLSINGKDSQGRYTIGELNIS